MGYYDRNLERRQARGFWGSCLAATLSLALISVTLIQFTPFRFINITLGPPVYISFGQQNNTTIINGTAQNATQTSISSLTKPTATPTPVNQEKLIVYFGDVTCYANKTFTGIKTLRVYKGKIRVTVSGTGQAKGTQRSDAYYIYTDAAQNPLPQPQHVDPENGLVDAVLWINDQPSDTFVNPIPPYKQDHTYSFPMTAPGGQVTFSIADCDTKHNTGSYTITIVSGG